MPCRVQCAAAVNAACVTGAAAAAAAAAAADDAVISWLMQRSVWPSCCVAAALYGNDVELHSRTRSRTGSAVLNDFRPHRMRLMATHVVRSVVCVCVCVGHAG